MARRRFARPTPLRLDPNARSARRGLPAFLAPPNGAPCYHGFPVLHESETDGWLLGVISDPNSTTGRDWGDAFVIAPDGRRAGLVWSVSADSQLVEASPPCDLRWGVYAFGISRLVHSEQELIVEFRRILPQLKEIHRKLHGQPRRDAPT